MDKKKKYDNLGYAGFEGISGGNRNWEAHDSSANTVDWTDYNGYGGGGYGYGGYGNHGRGSGDRKNEE